MARKTGLRKANKTAKKFGLAQMDKKGNFKRTKTAKKGLKRIAKGKTIARSR